MFEPPRHPGNADTGPPPIRRCGIGLLKFALLALATLALLAAARPTARPPMRSPRLESVIRQLLAAGPHAGECERCHTGHGDDQPLVYPNALVGPDDNSLCLRCHSTPWSGGSLADDPLYRATGHGANTRMVWPGPEPGMRIEIDAATKCVNCHDPHGWSDALGPIPYLAVQREERLCLTCHDGSPSRTDVASDTRKAFRHPTTDFSDRHRGPNETLPSDFGATPINRRHAECADCHNPHVSRADVGVPDGNVGSSLATLGVSRVAVLNGAAGTRPSYTFLSGADTLTAPVAEYQLCFKCHSSWTTQPAAQTDLALLLNPANPSFHPVEAAGKNPNIALAAFAPGWSAGSITRCGSCHGSDFGGAEGPHGSSYPHLLRRPWTDNPASRSMASDELCFSCHAYDVYANASSPGETRLASRFNPPGVGKGHAEHVDEERIPCNACHASHGSASQPFLMATGVLPGLLSYTATASGGTCTSTCHGTETYRANYVR